MSFIDKIKLLCMVIKNIGKSLYIISYRYKGFRKTEYYTKFTEFYLRYMELRDNDKYKNLFVLFK